MKRHALSTRLWHWVNLVCVVVLFMSGLTISNAHRLLYWGDWGFSSSQAWLEVPRFPDWMTIPGYYDLALARDWHILTAWPFALGLLFMWADDGIVSCVDAATGDEHWKKRIGGNYSGSPICVDGKLYCVSEDGEVVVLAASKEYELLARNNLEVPSRSTPAVIGGRLLLRTYSHLISLGKPAGK